jgi:hypothetical protein
MWKAKTFDCNDALIIYHGKLAFVINLKCILNCIHNNLMYKIQFNVPIPSAATLSGDALYVSSKWQMDYQIP